MISTCLLIGLIPLVILCALAMSLECYNYDPPLASGIIILLIAVDFIGLLCAYSSHVVLRNDTYNIAAIIESKNLTPKVKVTNIQDKDGEITVEVENLFNWTTYEAYQYKYEPPKEPEYEKYHIRRKTTGDHNH